MKKEKGLSAYWHEPQRLEEYRRHIIKCDKQARGQDTDPFMYLGFNRIPSSEDEITKAYMALARYIVAGDEGDARELQLIYENALDAYYRLEQRQPLSCAV